MKDVQTNCTRVTLEREMEKVGVVGVEAALWL